MKLSWIQALTDLLVVGSGRGTASPKPPPLQIPSSGHFHSASALQPRSLTHLNAQRVHITYGPFTVPPASKNNGVETFTVEAAPPCKGCFVTRIQADLAYPNGTSAGGGGGGAADTTGPLSLRHVLITNLEPDSATCPLLAEPVYVSGDERTAADISLRGTLLAGYHLSPTTRLTLTAKLSNTLPTTPQDAILSVDWEYVPSSFATGFRNVTPVWLDVDGGCPAHDGSEVPVPSGSGGGGGDGGAFNLTMDPPWTAGFAGEAVLVVPHLHDGGETLEVRRGGEVVCRAVAGYGEGDGKGGRGAGGGGGGRLSSVGTCERIGRVEVGESWGVVARYDFGKHAPVEEGGAPAPVMGVALVYVVKDGQ